MDAKRILWVEDDQNDVMLGMRILQSRGLDKEIVAAPDGVLAFEYFKRLGPYKDHPPGLPAVVLLDLKLPRLNGFEVLRQIRGNPALKTIPVVVLTSSRQDRDIHEAYELGANAYVVKHIEFKRFAAALESVVGFWLSVNEAPLECRTAKTPAM